MLSFPRTLTAALAIFGLAAGRCHLPGGDATKVENSIETDSPWCNPQGEGAYTFTMHMLAVEVPTADGDNPNAGYSQNWGFIIYDNNCKALTTYGGEYNLPDNKCGIPYEIEENFLDYVLIVDRIMIDIGNTFFRFHYGAGSYQIGENHCVCHDIHNGLQAAKVCPCAFPVHGEPEKRGIAASFEA